MEPTGETEERAPHTEMEENTHGRAESDRMDRTQENSKEQDEVKSASGRLMFYLGTKRTKKEREREERMKGKRLNPPYRSYS